MKPSHPSSLPLEGVRVLDLSRLLPGPFCSLLLSDLGAEVIKIEDSQGDYTRYFPPLCVDGNSAAFHSLNRGKKSISLDLKSQKDHATFLELLHTADVLIETFRPSVMDKLQLSLPFLRSAFPHLIICSISGYGQWGPSHLRAGHDVNYLATAGTLGMAMKPPSVLPVQVADLAGGAYPACIQILAALYHQQRTHRGAVIDVSMMENALALSVMQHARYEGDPDNVDGAIADGSDMLHGRLPNYNVYPTADGFISCGALEPKFYEALCRELGIPWRDGGDMYGEEAKAVLRAKFGERTNAEWRLWVEGRDVMCEVVEKPEGIFRKNRHFVERGVTVDVEVTKDNKGTASHESGVQKMTLLTSPLRMDLNPSKPASTSPPSPSAPTASMRYSSQFPTTAGPKLGEHTKEVLDELKKRKEAGLKWRAKL